MNIVKLFILPALLVLLTLDPTVSTAEKKKVIFLTQIPCMFIESEKEIQNYTSKSPADCERINEKTMNDRKLTNLTLKAGTYTFRITNQSVPYELGFWLRGKGLKRATLPSVSGGGLMTGDTQDYEITLKRGEYYYSCPLNPTPNYTLTVQ